MKKIILTIIFVMGFSQVASACSCRPEKSVEEAFSGANNVFTGAVIKGEVIKDEQYPYGNFEYEIKIIEGFKAAQSSTITIKTKRSTASCGFNFKLGKRYLVYTYVKDEDEIWVGLCSRTKFHYEIEEELNELKKIMN